MQSIKPDCVEIQIHYKVILFFFIKASLINTIWKTHQQKPFASTKQKFFFLEEKKKAILLNFWGFLIPWILIFSLSNSSVIRACAMCIKSVEWDPLKYIARYTIIFYCQLFFALCVFKKLADESQVNVLPLLTARKHQQLKHSFVRFLPSQLDVVRCLSFKLYNNKS